MADHWMELLNKAALNAIEGAKPAGIMYGTVIDQSPLQIQLEQKLTLTQAQLVLSRNVTRYQTDLTIDGIGKTTAMVHNDLSSGERVILLREQGGQRFLVLDRC